MAIGVRAGFEPDHPPAGPLRARRPEGRKEQGLRIERIPKRTAKHPRRLTTSPTRWLVVRDGDGRLEPLWVEDGGSERMLPVFSFEEEAELFLRLGDYHDAGWRARESSVGELVSVLYGPCAGVKGVALDPLPEMLADGTLALVGVGRERFLGRILAGEGRTA